MYEVYIYLFIVLFFSYITVFFLRLFLFLPHRRLAGEGLPLGEEQQHELNETAFVHDRLPPVVLRRTARPQMQMSRTLDRP